MSISFGRKIGDNTKAAWRKAKETNYVIDFSKFSESFNGWANMDIIDFIKGRGQSYRVNDLAKRPVSDLKTMLHNELEIIKG